MAPVALYEVVAQPQEITWLPWAVQYFFFIGIAACAALVAFIASNGRTRRSRHLERICLFIAITCAITAPLALAADLHQVARFWHFYAWPTPWSWMPWGALFIPVFIGFLGLWFCAFHLDVYTHRYRKLRFALALITVLAAVGLLVYTGREVSVVRARPVWFSYWLLLGLFFSALQTLFALLTLAMRNDTRLSRLLARAQLLVLLWLAAVLVYWFMGDTLSGHSLREWWQLSADARFLMLTAVALWLTASGFAAYASLRAVSLPLGLLHIVAAMALCWLLRWALLIGGQTLPKYNALFNPYTLPWGTDGVMAIVGTFGLWLALMISLHAGLNWLTARIQHD